MKRIALPTLLAAGLLLATAPAGVAAPVGPAAPVGLAAPVELAAPARPDVVTVPLPAVIAVPAVIGVAARTVTFPASVEVGASVTGLRSASLWYTYPDARARTLVGTATSRTSGSLTVVGRLDARRIAPGRIRVLVLDDVEGDARTIELELRRRSRVAVTRAELRADGRAELDVLVRHYDHRTGGYVPSRLSPVRLQEQVGGRWVTVATVTTDRTGTAAALVPAGPGAHRYRAVRPDGRTVLAATSRPVEARRG